MMKNVFLPFLMAALMPVLFSCKKSNSDTESLAYVYIGTEAAENVTPVSAKLMSNIRFVNISGGQMNLRFYYSEKRFDRYTLDDSEVKRTEFETFDVGDGKFGITVEGLKPNTTYYYMPYLSVKGISLVDVLMDFTTQNYCVTQEATDVDLTSATLNAMTVLSPEEIAQCVFAFEYTDLDFEQNARTTERVYPGEDGKFSFNLTGLTSGTTYWFRAVVIRNGHREYADEERSFKTE